MHYLLDQVLDELEPVFETVPFVPLLLWLCFPPLCAPLEPNAHFTRPSKLGSRSPPCCLSGFLNDETFSSMYSRLSLELDEGRLPIELWGMLERYIRFKIFDRQRLHASQTRLITQEATRAAVSVGRKFPWTTDGLPCCWWGYRDKFSASV